MTLTHPVFCTFQYLISSCNKCSLIFLYINATGYWLHLGDIYSSSSCLEVFLIHDERSKHLVKPWMKVTDAIIIVLACLFHLISVWGVHLQLLVFLVPFHLVLTTLHQPLVYRYIKQVDPDTFRQTFNSSLLLGFDAILRPERTDSQRPQTQSNNPNLYCLIPFLGGFNDFCGWHQTSQDLKARNFRWNPAEHTIASKAKKPASPADVTRALAPDLLSRGREPEHYNFKHS